jgi:hypothetical protein
MPALVISEMISTNFRPTQLWVEDDSSRAACFANWILRNNFQSSSRTNNLSCWIEKFVETHFLSLTKSFRTVFIHSILTCLPIFWAVFLSVRYPYNFFYIFVISFIPCTFCLSDCRSSYSFFSFHFFFFLLFLRFSVCSLVSLSTFFYISQYITPFSCPSTFFYVSPFVHFFFLPTFFYVSLYV